METKSSFYFGVAPMVERVAVNHLVGGSNPSPEAAQFSANKESEKTK